MHAQLDALSEIDERQFALAVRRLADSLSYGADASPYLGSGIEYMQSRLYQLGDPIRSIDWRITARTGRLHVKEYQAPKRMPIYLLVDTSASMCVSSQRLNKYGWAVHLAGGLALAAISRLSPVGLITCGESRFIVQPSLSRQQVMRWLHQLRRYRFDERTTLAESLHVADSMASRRSVLIVISDLHDPRVVPALTRLATKHDCIVLQLFDPAEQGRTGGGIFRAQEAETSNDFVTTGRSRWIDHAPIAQEMKRHAVDHLRLSIDEQFIPHLREFLRRRDCLGRMAR